MPSSSSPSVSLGLHSCLEPRQSYSLKKAHVSYVEKEADSGWSTLLFSLSQPTQSPLAAIDAASHKIRIPVVPPTSYPNTHQLKKRNLELCTETLGCETGATYTQIDFPIEAPLVEAREDAMVKKGRRKMSAAPSEFPPPLTTLCGEGRLGLTSRRIDGRLQLLSFKPTILEAERRDGRLCLRIFRDCTGESEEVKVNKEKKGDDVKGRGKDEGVEGESVNVVGNVRDEVGIGKYRWAGRCKEEEAGGARMSRRSKAMLQIVAPGMQPFVDV